MMLNRLRRRGRPSTPPATPREKTDWVLRALIGLNLALEAAIILVQCLPPRMVVAGATRVYESTHPGQRRSRRRPSPYWRS